MKFEIAVDRIYPHPPDSVWRALTDRELLGQWLMETDFVPEEGESFSMWCDDGEGGIDRYLCRLLEYEPPCRMLWSWVVEGRQHLGETLVAFSLEEVPGGTRLTVRHSGDGDPATIDAFKSGWPTKLDRLEDALR